MPEPDAGLLPSAPLATETPDLPAEQGNALPPIQDTSAEPAKPAAPSAPEEPTVPRWNVHVRLETSLTYDSNVFIQPRNRQSDFYFGITPLIAAGWGRFLADPSTVTGVASRFPQLAARDGSDNLFLFRYAPTAQVFVRRSDQDAVDQDVMLAGRWTTGKLTLDAAARFQKLTAPDIDVGNRIESTITSAFVNENYHLTEKTSLDSRFAFEHDSYQGGLASTDLSLTSMLNYQMLPKTMLGLGVGGGYTTVESGQEQYYEQVISHWRYEPTYKLTFEGTAGAEFRQINRGPRRVTPVVEFAAHYAAEDATMVSLSVSRRTEASALYGDQDIERTTVEGSIRQRFFQKVYLNLSGGYQHIDYVDAGAAANRSDDYLYCGVEASAEITRWLSMRASYRRQVNESSTEDFSFGRNLAELQFNVQF